MPTTLIVDADDRFLAACDDCRDSRRVRGHRFLYARDDAEAVVQLSADQTIDLALVAIDGAGGGGLDLFAKIPNRSVRVPRIALTAKHDLTEIRRAMTAGAADFLVKPVAESDLLDTIERVFRLCEERRAAWRNQAELAAIRNELDLAGQLQRRLLPQSFPAANGLDIAASLHPAEQMSGDFFDAFELDPHRVAVVIGDVTGHGVHAAFYMGIVRTLLRAAISNTAGVAESLTTVNELMVADTAAGMLASAFVGIIETQTWSFTHSNAGHPHPLIRKAASKEVVALSGEGGPILGAVAGFDYELGMTQLRPDDTVCMFTDGYVEARDIEKNEFGLGELEKHLAEKRWPHANSLIRQLEAALDEHTTGVTRADDLTLMAFRRG